MKEKIINKIHEEMDGLMDANGNFEYPEHEGAYNALCNLEAYIESLQEEPVSEELEEASKIYVRGFHCAIQRMCKEAFMDGANWQKGKTIDKAIEWLYQKQISVPNIDEFINDFKRYVED